ncbi:MAG: leucine-rich repeat domain-containing protein [Prevotella sp.]|nr:leucine-rich repeat domain-containing protein [Prevotella sp.]
MKKQLLILVMVFMSLTVNSAAVLIDGINYTLSTRGALTATVVSISGGYSGDIVIPSSVVYNDNEFSVISIGSGAFSNSYGLTSVTIPNSVTGIENSTFSGCSGLTSITIGSGVAIIGEDAFKDCSNLTTVNITDLEAWCKIPFNWKNSPMMYAKHLLLNGEEIKDLVIPNDITTIGCFTFRNCSGLSSVTIPTSVTIIEGEAFEYCSNLTSVTIPNSITTIGGSAFFGCNKLNAINIPNSVTSIGSNAFSDCSGITSIIVENGNTYYDSRENCNAIIETSTNTLLTGCQNSTIPNGITNIENNAFRNCSGLVSITIPNCVTAIGENAFAGCTGLATITIPNSVLSIGKSAFYGCSGLTSATISNSVTEIGTSIFQNCTSLTSIDIPNSVTIIGSTAFGNCTSLTFVTIPNSVTSIYSGAFSGCTSLTSVTIPNSVTHIERGAFDALISITFLNEVVSSQLFTDRQISKKNLKEIILGEGVKTVGEKAFYGWENVEKVEFASTVTSIGARAFSGTNKLTDVTCRAINVPEMDRTAFENSYPNYATLHVPAVSIAAYQSTAPWNEFKEIVAIKQDLPDDAEKCATPTITYQNGKLAFESATEGVEFLYQITDNDIKSGTGNEIQLDATYHISVYATKEGYKDSETATAALCWIDQKPATEGITNGVANVPANAVLIQNDRGMLSISGVPAGTAINVYDLSGKTAGSAKASSGTTNIATTLRSGEVVVVKIGDRSVKFVIR